MKKFVRFLFALSIIVAGDALATVMPSPYSGCFGPVTGQFQPPPVNPVEYLNSQREIAGNAWAWSFSQPMDASYMPAIGAAAVYNRAGWQSMDAGYASAIEYYSGGFAY